MASPRFPFYIQAGACTVALAATLAIASPRAGSAAPVHPRAHPTVHKRVAATPVPSPLPSPEAILQKIRAVFRSHRPPPPFVSYTIIRKNDSAAGFPDYANSYTEHVWVRSSDRAALSRRVYRDEDRGPLTFERPAFNEPRDPGPPTADLFERAPVKPHVGLNDYIPTPEPSAPENIANVKAIGETAYKVVAVAVEGPLLHLSVVPFRDVERNRLREIYVDKITYELRKVVATDRLYDLTSGASFGVIFTVDLQMLQGRPVVTRIHGVVGDGYNGDDQTVNYWFNDIRFPASLPGWYFDPRDYAAHTDTPDEPI